MAGTLRVSRNGNLQLSLVGALGPADAVFADKSHPVILGSVEKSPSGNDVTLTGCMLAGTTVGSFADTRARYLASRGFFGAILPQKADLAFRQLRLRLSGLTEWAGSRSGLKPGGIPGYTTGEGVSLGNYIRLGPLSAPVPGGIISLDFGVEASQSLHSYTIQEEAYLNANCETPASADELNGTYGYPLQNLMTFVCDRAQEIKRFSVWPGGVFSDKAAKPEIQVIGPRVQPEDDVEAAEPVRAFQMLFTLEDVDFADLIGKWMRLADRYSDACSIFFGLQYGPPAYIDMTLLGVVQALSLYYAQREEGIAQRAEEERRLKEVVSALPPADADWIVDHLGVRPYPPFQGVLRALLDEHSAAMNPLVSKRQDRFVNEVRNTLHYVVHREAVVGLAASRGAELYWMMQKLRVLLKACFLSELGFTPKKALELFERNALYQHMCALEAARESARKGS
ncbi:MAG: hypothetical protein L0Z62_49270 [Gemmataceae bacterium]|nr:hypothetical protein [Gemmataceae bacterium]